MAKLQEELGDKQTSEEAGVPTQSAVQVQAPQEDEPELNNPEVAAELDAKLNERLKQVRRCGPRDTCRSWMVVSQLLALSSSPMLPDAALSQRTSIPMGRSSFRSR